MEAKPIEVSDIIRFRNKSTGTKFVAKVLKHKGAENYLLEILECDVAQFVNTQRVINFGESRRRIVVESIESFEGRLALENMEKYLALCHSVVDFAGLRKHNGLADSLEDRQKFDEYYAQYALWKGEFLVANKLKEFEVRYSVAAKVFKDFVFAADYESAVESANGKFGKRNVLAVNQK